MRTRARSVLILAAALVALAAGAPAHAGAPPASRSGAEKRLTSAESYLPVNGLSATLSEDMTPIGLIMVDGGLDIPDAALRSRAERMQPRLRDGLRAALAEYALVRWDGGAPDADLLARMLQRSVDATMGESGARFLLANLMVQRRPGR